jgi:6-phosphofructokinase 2
VKNLIYTLTTNPAIDMNIKSNKIVPAKVNRTIETTYFATGKGINVSLVLKHYGVKSKILGFFGGFTGKYIVDELVKQGFDVKAIWIDNLSRINVFINDGENEFKFLDKGPLIPIDKQVKLKDVIEKLNDCSYLVISGSLPPNVDDSYYDDILKICVRKNIKVILDISSKKLKDLLIYKPLLIKPNNDEIKEIFGYDVSNEEKVGETLKKINKMGAQNILLTMGSKGMYFYNGKHLYFCDTPEINLVSSACAGDSALAAFLSEWLFNQNIDMALRKSSATGANVAESWGIGELKNIYKYLDLLNVKEVF